LFNSLKLALQSFKKNWKDYLAISFVFSAIVFIGVLIGQSMIGMLLAFVGIVIPAIISLKFCVFQYYNKDKVEDRSLKIGFMTFFKSIKIYSIVILKPLLIAFVVGSFVYSFFLSSGIEVASKTIPNLVEALANYDTFIYTYEEMLGIEEVKKILNTGLIVSLSIGYLVYFSLKLKRDFIPFVAFEMPITSKRAVAMNQKVLKGRYIKFFITNFLIVLMFVVPGLLAYLTKIGLESNAVYSSTTVFLMSALVFCLVSGPIATLKQLHYIYAYKAYSKPFEEDFNNELKNVIKEIEELQKIINEKEEK